MGGAANHPAHPSWLDKRRDNEPPPKGGPSTFFSRCKHEQLHSGLHSKGEVNVKGFGEWLGCWIGEHEGVLMPGEWTAKGPRRTMGDTEVEGVYAGRQRREVKEVSPMAVKRCGRKWERVGGVVC